LAPSFERVAAIVPQLPFELSSSAKMLAAEPPIRGILPIIIDAIFSSTIVNGRIAAGGS